MKILIISDNHGRLNYLEAILSRDNFDRVIHCGDSEVDRLFINNIDIVKGNSYLDPDYPYLKIFNVEGLKILITHGHLHNVHNGLNSLLYKALQEKIDIVCFGHTHIPLITEEKGVLFVNPGSLSMPRGESQSSYMIMEITDKIYLRQYNLANEEISYYERSK